MFNGDDAITELLKAKRAEERERHNANRAAFADWLNATAKKPIDPFYPKTDGGKAAGIAALDAFVNGLPEEQPETQPEEQPETQPEESAPEVRDGSGAEQAAGEHREPKKSIAEKLNEKLKENSLTDDGNPWHRL